MSKPISVNHIAICTADMKAQIEFFTDVLGMELVALYPIGDEAGTVHGYLKFNDSCSLILVYTPETGNIKPIKGISHAKHPALSSAPGTIQHIAFNVDSFDEMILLRDRIRSKGVNILGPLDHGMCQSMYFGGPEDLTLEIATSEEGITPELWVDQEVVDLAGINAEELATFIKPASYQGQGGKVPQPKRDMSKPQLVYDGPLGDKIFEMSDEEVSNALSHSGPSGIA